MRINTDNFLPSEYSGTLENGTFTWRSPSNIALVKYWGKYGEQLPKNPSISFTLSNCHTVTSLDFQKKQQGELEFDVLLDGRPVPDFRPKIQTFFKRIEQYLPFLRNYKFTIRTSNSFPHSSGIASSASGMSALALCLMSLERELFPEMSGAHFNQKASFLARLGSGSACRSVEGPLVVWGQHKDIVESNDLFGISYPYEVHTCFGNYQDTILLVDKGEKQVSSTVGHGLMHGHPFAEARFLQANENLSRLITVIREGDLSEFITIVESEALSLHAMMLTSDPYFILMKPNTLKIIERIWEYRKDMGSNVCFTLDAGANVHVLYPEAEKETTLQFIKTKLSPFCKNGEYISDQTGSGASAI